MEDDLTPVEPEFREEPPKTPPEDPNYYGTGRQPQPKKSHLPLILTLCVLLLSANLITLIVALTREETAPCPTEELCPLIPDAGETEEVEPWSEDSLPSLSGHLTLQKIYDSIAPSTVVVVGQNDYGHTVSTGLILTEDGYLMTTAEAGGKDLMAVTSDGKSYDASYVGIDGDTLILKIEAEDLTTVEMDKQESFRVQKVIEALRDKEEEQVHLEVEISELTESTRIFWNLPEGVFIEKISKTCSAYLAGIRPGDVLMQIGHRKVHDVTSYLDALQQFSWGDTVRVYLYRDGKTYYTDFRLEKNEK